MLFDKIIRKYKYIAGGGAPVDKVSRIFKEGKFPQHDFPLFKPPKELIQKKIYLQATVSAQPTSKRVGVDDTSTKTFPDVKTPTGVNQNNVYEISDSADTVAENLEARLKVVKEKSYNQGFQEGRLKGIAEGTARADQISQIFNNVIEELNKKSNIFFEEVEKWMLDLSVHLAEKIVSEAATNMPEVVKANVDKCINLLAGSGEVAVKINPADYEIVKAYLPNLEHKFEGKFSFLLKPDQNITGGGCLIEMNGSVIDGRIETQLAKIKQQMMILS